MDVPLLEPPVDLTVWRRILRRKAKRRDFESVARPLLEQYSRLRRGRGDARWYVFYVPRDEHHATCAG